jgi:glucose/arabinose dehydrogenase
MRLSRRSPMACTVLAVSWICLLVGLLHGASAATTVRVASGLDFPVFVTAPPGDGERLFILLQAGKIVVLKNGTLLPVPFLDIDGLIPDVSAYDERGLLGMAFHPQYASNGFFYLDYIGLDNSTNIVRYTVSGDPDVADAASATLILNIPQPYGNHNGGMLAFGPQDGDLYIGMGDGGSEGDPGDRGQDLTTLLGKLLRIDVDGGAPYAIPPDNPYAAGGGPLPEIWASGLRNPWRYSFDRGPGDLYIADVGQWDWEELDFQPATAGGGQNYGWRLMEGNHCYNPPTDCNDGTLTLPVYEYDHAGLACSITGGYVYRGSAIPELQGQYFFADYCSNQIHSLRIVDGAVTDLQDRTAELAPGQGLTIENIASFGEDGLGELYIVDRTANLLGEVYKIVANETPASANTTWGAVKSAYH